jgi:cysteine desulfurase
MIYLDYAAATPLDKKVKTAMEPYFAGKFYNPSALYLSAQSVHKDIEKARSKVAQIIGARPSEIIFTAGGTEANNLAIHGVMRHFRDTNIIVSAVEHDAVLEPAKLHNHRVLPVRPDGQVDVPKLEKLIDGRTVLVSVMHANNEIGTIQPLKEVKQVLDKIRKKRSRQDNPLPLYLHTDACQSANYLDIHVARLGADLMTLNGGKIYGPKQSGVLYVRAGVRLQPLVSGGGQEWGLRSGTENPASIVGFAEALTQAQETRSEEGERLAGLQRLFIDLLGEKLPDASVNGSSQNRLPNNIHVTFPGQDNERLLMQLDEKGIICAAGSACSASSDEPSHVLKAIGLSDEQARSSLRFTMGRQTTEDDIRRAVETLREVLSIKYQV